MSRKLSLDELVVLAHDEFEGRIAACHARIEGRIQRATNEQRDFTEREKQLSEADLSELVSLRDADELRAARRDELARMQSEARSKLVGDAISQFERSQNLSPLLPSAENLARLEEARSMFASLSLIEQRAAIKTSDMGSAVEYGPNGLAAPRTLWRASGIPTTAPTGYTGVVPQFTLPAGASLVSEGNAHAEFDAVSPDSVTIGRAGAWSDLTAEGMLSTSLTEISTAHARIIARDLDKATVAKIEQAPSAYDIDEALVVVASEAAVDVSALWIVGQPTAIAALVGNAVLTPANGTDLGSYAVRYGGASLYATPAASAGDLTVFDPASFRAFATPLASAVVVDPTTGTQRFGQWQFFGLGQSLVGSAVTISGQGS